ncbi:MAG TPA: hypothetical protein VMV92_26225 [Streptosporangiaceae bacterium]|nr:hypothetical protein [Streptosporangiaceae bacterium]
MTDAASGGRCQAGAQGARRSRQRCKRACRVEFTQTAGEFAVVQAAARRAGLARGAYAAQVTLAAATGTGAGGHAPLREALAELIRAAGLVRRIGVNLNQAVAKLNATGQRPGELPGYAAESIRRAQRLDAAAEQVRKTLP